MVKVRYIPDRGDVVWVNLNSARGHEQAGRRPVFVISSKFYNKKSGLMLACPITSRIKNYPFEVVFSSGRIKGAILTDQIRSMDWNDRNADFAGQVNGAITRIVQGKLTRLVEG